MSNVAYLRVSTDEQNANSQRLAVLDFAHRKDISIDEFVETTVSSRKSTKERGIDELIENLSSGDTLIVAELSRLGRSLSQIIKLVDEILQKNINFIAVKEGIELLDGKQDLKSKVMVTMFGLFAEIERDLISQRTKEGLEAAKAKGKLIGRPKGPGKSKLDGKEKQIQELLEKKVSKSSIAKIMGCSRTALVNFIDSRNLV